MTRVNALSIDVEEWYHPELVRDHVGPRNPERRIESSLQPLVSLLDRHRVKASFFFLGDVASSSPDLVRRLHQGGHEIACHGMSHLTLQALGPAGLKAELREFLGLMRGILGETKIRGFRAPSFSLSPRTQWALPILHELGFEYDASLFPARIPGNALYGVRGAPRIPYHVSLDDLLKEDPQSALVEFPNTILFWRGLPLPLAGGFYLRVFPLWILVRGLRRVNRFAPFNLYLHPWETDPQTPRLRLGAKNRWITYHGIESALEKVEHLLRQFPFSRVDHVLASHFQN